MFSRGHVTQAHDGCAGFEDAGQCNKTPLEKMVDGGI